MLSKALPESVRTDEAISLPLSAQATAEVKVHSTLQQLRLNMLRLQRARQAGASVDSYRARGEALEQLAKKQLSRLS